jgi:hypothetical protein
MPRPRTSRADTPSLEPTLLIKTRRVRADLLGAGGGVPEALQSDADDGDGRLQFLLQGHLRGAIHRGPSVVRGGISSWIDCMGPATGRQ